MRIEVLQSLTTARLVVVPCGATLRTIAQALSSRSIGIVVVCDENKAVVGVVSRFDIVRHLGDTGVMDAPVEQLMSRSIVACRPEDNLYATWQSMAAQNLQNMPVLDPESRPLGVLDARDALKVLFEQEEYQERLLVNYVAGVGYQ